MLTGAQLIRREYLDRIRGPDPFRPTPPQVPTPRSRRGAIVARQNDDLRSGYFTERVFEIGPFPILTVAAPTATLLRQVPSTKSKYVRLVAMRGIVQFSNTLPLTGLEPGALLLRLVLNGSDDLIPSQRGGTNFASFDMLFSHTLGQYVVPAQLDATLSSDPWFWFAAPPRLRVGDRIQATITNTANFEGSPSLGPELALRLADNDWYERLYLGKGQG